MFKSAFAAIAVTTLVASTIAPTAPATAAETVKSGSFRGAGGHKASGGVRLVKDGNRYKVVFSGNFKLDGAPDPRVAFGNGGYKKGTIIARLRKTRGSQSYTVPKSLNPTKYSQIWLWCKKFSAPLGVASVK